MSEIRYQFALRRTMGIPILPGFLTLSSRGPGHRPFTAVTRVRIPLGSLCYCVGKLFIGTDDERFP
jgi:hypothetical protein